MNRWIAQRNLSILWFTNAGVIGLIFVILTISGRFGTKTNDGWQWFSQNIVPTLTLMIGTFTAVVGQKISDTTVEKFYYNLAFFISTFYFIALYLTIFLAPLAFNDDQTSFVDVLNNSRVYLNIIQGIATFSLGLFFTRKSSKK